MTDLTDEQQAAILARLTPGQKRMWERLTGQSIPRDEDEARAQIKVTEAMRMCWDRGDSLGEARVSIKRRTGIDVSTPAIRMAFVGFCDTI